MKYSRRQFLKTSSSIGLGLAATLGRAAEKRDLATAFDAEMDAFMRARDVPGGALAVVKGKRLVYAKGYGWANREKQTPVVPESLFRIASISKPFTAVAVMQLVEQGKLKLEQPVFDWIADSLCGGK